MYFKFHIITMFASEIKVWLNPDCVFAWSLAVLLSATPSTQGVGKVLSPDDTEHSLSSDA